jgi:hypothetical protein
LARRRRTKSIIPTRKRARKTSYKAGSIAERRRVTQRGIDVTTDILGAVLKVVLIYWWYYPLKWFLNRKKKH